MSSQVSVWGKFAKEDLYFIRRSQSAAAIFVGTKSRAVVAETEFATADLAARYLTRGNSCRHPLTAKIILTEPMIAISFWRSICAGYGRFLQLERESPLLWDIERKNRCSLEPHLQGCKYCGQAICNGIKTNFIITGSLAKLPKELHQCFVIICGKSLQKEQLK